MKNRSLFIALFLVYLSFNEVYAQGSPAPAQDKSILLKGGNIHTGSGTYLEATDILFDSGKIVRIEKNIQSSEAEIIDVSGQEVYPGLIALNTNLGLVEIDAVRATRDFEEVGEFNPHVRSIIAYNTDSDILPTIRSNGVLLAQVTPEGGYISGQSSLVQLDAWNWEDAAVKTDDGVHLRWPTNYDLYRSSFPSWFTPPSEKYEDKVKEISEFFTSSATYNSKGGGDKTDLRREAMRGVFSKSKKLYVHVDGYAEMLDAMDLLAPYNLDIVIMGGEQADKISEYLREKNIPVVVISTHVLPSFDEDAYDARFTLPNRLLEEQLTVALTHEGSWRQRNIPFQAGQAVAYGLPYEEAVKAITLTPAQIIGVSDDYGSLEVGKSATIVVSKGDLLDMATSQLSHAFIDGRVVDLDDKQKKLYRKFSSKYGHSLEEK